MVLRKESFTKHIGHIRLIFDKLHNSGIKVSANKYTLGLILIIYLCYIISWDGIKYYLVNE